MTSGPTLSSEDLRHFAAGGVLLATYVAAYQIAALYSLAPVILYVATVAAVAVLFFIGVRRWWMVPIAVIVAGLTVGLPLNDLIIWTVGDTAAAVVAAQTLIALSVDPIFRKFKDMLSLIVVSFSVSAILPTVRLVGAEIAHSSGSLLPSAGFWSENYVAAVCALLIVVPFVLRWFSKRRFGRNFREILELVAVFGVLIAVNYAMLYAGHTRVAGVSLVYLLLVPLFWIALKLRPRFVTLAFVITGVMTIHSALIHPEAVGRLFASEGLLIVLAVIFYIIVSLEEDRRLNSNLMRHQLATLENAIARISSESKAKNDFIAVLAHELRNPLAPVVSGIDLLKLKNDRDPEDMETLNMMEDRMHMVRRLLDDLLDISRITENKLKVTDEPVELDAIVRHAILTTEHYRKERHQTFSYKPAGEPLVVLGDAARLEQVVTNLLTNASKYTDPGGNISLMLTRTGEQARIHVKDKGIGIDPTMLEAVFTPFHQIESGKRSIKGLGIGLALVRNFVEMHGGTVEARSEGMGTGSEFVVTLPLAGSDIVVDADPLEEAVRQPKGKKLRVLIVDDNDSAASALGKLLELQGHATTYAYDGEQALSRAASKAPDVVLLDLDLPDMTGYDVAKVLRERKYKGRLIALTGLSTVEAKAMGTEAGFDEYLLKPVGMEELKRVLHKGVAK